MINDVIVILVKEGRSDLASQIASLDKRHDLVMRDAEKVSTQLQITSQDRDARRGRMELAMLILDYEQKLPIEDLWQVATGQAEVMTEQMRRSVKEIHERMAPPPRSFGVGGGGGPSLYQPPMGMSDVQGRNEDGTYGTDAGRPDPFAFDEDGRVNGWKTDPTATPTPSQKHERRVVGHVSGRQEYMNTCVCGEPWPCGGDTSHDEAGVFSNGDPR